MTTISLDVVEQWCAAQEDVEARLAKLPWAQQSSSHTPWRQAIEAIRFMIDRAPFRSGDIVRICAPIKCTGGWSGFEDVLAVGQLCEVREVHVWDSAFVATAMPLEQWTTVWDGHLSTGQRTLLGMPSMKYAASLLHAQ